MQTMFQIMTVDSEGGARPMAPKPEERASSDFFFEILECADVVDGPAVHARACGLEPGQRRALTAWSPSPTMKMWQGSEGDPVARGSDAVAVPVPLVNVGAAPPSDTGTPENVWEQAGESDPEAVIPFGNVTLPPIPPDQATSQPMEPAGIDAVMPAKLSEPLVERQIVEIDIARLVNGPLPDVVETERVTETEHVAEARILPVEASMSVSATTDASTWEPSGTDRDIEKVSVREDDIGPHSQRPPLEVPVDAGWLEKPAHSNGSTSSGARVPDVDGATADLERNTLLPNKEGPRDAPAIQETGILDRTTRPDPKNAYLVPPDDRQPVRDRAPMRVEGRQPDQSIAPPPSHPPQSTAAAAASGVATTAVKAAAELRTVLAASAHGLSGLREAQTETANLLAATSVEATETVSQGSDTRGRPEPVSARSIVNQIIQSVTRVSGDNSIELRLQPEELGRVRLTMQTTDAGVSVQVSADRSETLDLLRRNIDVLENDLRKQGFASTSFSFGSNTSDDARMRRGDQNIESGSEREPVDDQSLRLRIEIAMPSEIGENGRLDIRV